MKKIFKYKSNYFIVSFIFYSNSRLRKGHSFTATHKNPHAYHRCYRKPYWKSAGSPVATSDQDVKTTRFYGKYERGI